MKTSIMTVLEQETLTDIINGLQGNKSMLQKCEIWPVEFYLCNICSFLQLGAVKSSKTQKQYPESDYNLSV